jgi:two-component system, chemotaxis family, chemotaxis protein CheY
VWVDLDTVWPRKAGMAMEATRTVLVIEDDGLIQDLLHEVLADAGCRVLHATDGEHGLGLAASDRPALILLDLGLPGTSGADILAKLTDGRDTKRIPIIAVTGQPASLGGGPFPLDGRIAKPFDLDVPRAQVGRVADLPSSAPVFPPVVEPARSTAVDGGV